MKPVRESDTQTGVTENPWQRLRDFTDARIGLGRAGVSLPTHALLEFQLAHAQAQDAVHQPLDVDTLAGRLAALSQRFGLAEPLCLHSQALDRPTYLQRPDLGRRLDTESAQRLRGRDNGPHSGYDLAIAIVDGLSSRAIMENSEPFLDTLLTQLSADAQEWRVAPLVMAQQGRVAIGDEIGALLNARTVLVMVGERPGLSSPDSLGLYMTWAPRVGLTDACRNCISNVRSAGLSYADAVRKLLYLLTESRRRQLSGVQLKERSDDTVIDSKASQNNFLVAQR